MSASEKLKALKPEGLVVTDAPDQGYTDVVCLSISAHAAVVAVVEAAEHSRQWAQDEVLEGPPELGLIDMELTAALDALEEVLS